jgi:hypothetical protein
MKLRFVASCLRIELEWYEQIFAITTNSTITIPLSHITNITNEFPNIQGHAIRAPGTHIPFVLKAGTFYTCLGKEFWYINQNIQNYLVLTLQDEEFAKIVVTIEDSQEWFQRIREKCSEENVGEFK